MLMEGEEDSFKLETISYALGMDGKEINLSNIPFN